MSTVICKSWEKQVLDNTIAIEELSAVEADLVQEVGRALKTPIVAPAATELVAIGTNNGQTNLTIGTGLAVEDGIISVSGGGHTCHTITVASQSYYVGGNPDQEETAYASFDIVDTDSTPITVDSLVARALAAGYRAVCLAFYNASAGSGTMATLNCMSSDLQIYVQGDFIYAADIEVQDRVK